MTTTPMQYLDKAMDKVRDLGLLPQTGDKREEPIVALLNQIADIDQDRIVAIARTLNQASFFNDVVREQVQAMKISDRYETITNSFKSIRDDAKNMVDQLDDGKISTFERVNNIWMKATRGDIADRFDKIKETYLDVTESTLDQIQREQLILDAYQDFRGALKQSEVLALEVLKKADALLLESKTAVETAMKNVDAHQGEEPAERAKLELARDEKLRELQDTEKRYQIAKDLSDNLTVSYNTSEVVMARLVQTTNAKERLYSQAISFFSTNETVLTALTASFTGMFGLHEATQTVEAMKEGVSESIEVLSEIGGKVQEAAIRAGYGPTIRADAVKKLVDSVVNFQENSRTIIEEMRRQSTSNAKEIQEAVEDGKRRMARLAEQGSKILSTKSSDKPA
ncbi:MAG: cell surface protein [Deltaproteobacteria bacterium]|nr:cell surface protein [Deltaproteobacteria bacterium]MBW2658311.1 cell surface protein [Deltaproteobacteria bacterium]